jgi:hypothetical protein
MCTACTVPYKKDVKTGENYGITAQSSYIISKEAMEKKMKKHCSNTKRRKSEAKSDSKVGENLWKRGIKKGQPCGKERSQDAELR